MCIFGLKEHVAPTGLMCLSYVGFYKHAAPTALSASTIIRQTDTRARSTLSAKSATQLQQRAEIRERS